MNFSPVHVRFMVDKLTMEKVSLSSSASFIPPMLLSYFRLSIAVTIMFNRGRHGTFERTITLPEILASLDRNAV